MKYVLYFLSLILLQVTFVNFAYAQDKPVTKSIARAYYKNCMQTPIDDIVKKDKKDFCGCTANKLMERFTLQDISDMYVDGVTTQEGIHSVLIKIYAPCITPSATKHLYTRCLKNPRLSEYNADKEILCSCSTKKVTTYIDENHEELFTRILKRDPDITEPMDVLDYDPTFNAFVLDQILACNEENLEELKKTYY